MAPSKRKTDADSSGASKKGRGAEAQEETSPLRFKAGNRVMVQYGKSGKRKRRQPATIKAASATTRKYSVIWDSTGDRSNDIEESDILEMTADEKKEHEDEGAEDKENEVPTENEAPTENEETAEPPAESQRDNPEDVDENPEDAEDDAMGGEPEIKRPKLVDETSETGYEGQGDWVSDLGEHPDTNALDEKWKDEGVTLEERKKRIKLIHENEVERGVIRRANCLATILLEEMQEEKTGVEERLAVEYGRTAEEAEKAITLGSQCLQLAERMPQVSGVDTSVSSLKAVIAEQRNVLRGVAAKYREEQKKLADKFESDFRANMAEYHVSQGELPQKVKDGIERLKMSKAFELDAMDADEPLEEP